MVFKIGDIIILKERFQIMPHTNDIVIGEVVDVSNQGSCYVANIGEENRWISESLLHDYCLNKYELKKKQEFNKELEKILSSDLTKGKNE